MTTTDVVYLIALIGAVFIGLANYRNSVRKADYDRLMSRVVDAEARLAQAEHRATTSEIQTQGFRHDVIKLGEQLDKERHLSNRNLAIVAKDAEQKIEKMLLLIEDLYAKREQETGQPPDMDLAALRKVMGLKDHVTGPLGPIDLLDLIRADR